MRKVGLLGKLVAAAPAVGGSSSVVLGSDHLCYLAWILFLAVSGGFPDFHGLPFTGDSLRIGTCFCIK